MERDNSRQDQWLDTAVGGIRFGYDRKAVREELAAHLEDKTADFQRIFPDMTAEEAEQRAVGEMGDAAELRSALAKIYRPWLGWLWRASQAALALLLLVMTVVGANTVGGSSNLGGWYRRGNDWRAEEYGAAVLNPTAEEANVEGYSITVSRTALWPDGEEAVLEVLLRVENLRFWRKGGNPFDLVSARDDLGGYYFSQYERTQLGLWSADGYVSALRDGWGVFHQSYLLRVYGVDPQAQWIELNYDWLGRSFSLRIDLTEEAEE